MKGGITSGVVYPKAIAEIADKFRFKSIGGASAGAIAAAGSAAAEYGRLNGEAAAFQNLAALTDDLGAETGRGSEKLLTALFQAGPVTRALEGTIKGVNAATRGSSTRDPNEEAKKGLGTKIVQWARVGGAPIANFPRYSVPAGLVGLLLFVALLFGLYFFARSSDLPALITVPIVVVMAVVALAVPLLVLCVVSWIAVLRSALRDIPDNYLGIALGHAKVPDPNRPALTDWLDDVIQHISGADRRPTARQGPLTFGDLWAGSRQMTPSEQRPLLQRSDKREVNLEVITTCLTLGTPFRMPFGMEKFFFRPSEFYDLFPEHVVKHMITTGQEEARRRNHIGAPVVDDETLVAWPHPADIPVVVAARMSLSFPLLISAVPLWAADFTWDVNQGLEKNKSGLHVERCWFSDGGISSNFPIHLFDAPFPRWPTFGINLRHFHPSKTKSTVEASNVELATQYGSEIVDPPWRNIDVPPEKSDGSQALPTLGQPKIGKFIAAIIDSMKHWQDDALLRVPGYRDRVAHVLHDDNEGGMNLDMPKERIDALADRGRVAGARLADMFSREWDGDTPSSIGWENHRWVRYRTAMAALEQFVAGMNKGYGAALTPTYQQLVSRDPNPDGVYQWRREQRVAVANRMTEIVELVSEWMDEIEDSSQGFGHKAPSPLPELRIRPRL